MDPHKKVSIHKCSLKTTEKEHVRSPDCPTRKQSQRTQQSRSKSGYLNSTNTKSNAHTHSRSIKVFLQENYQLLREENQELLRQLRRKVKKIDKLKTTIKVYQARLCCYQEMLGSVKGSADSATDASAGLDASRKQYEAMVREAQQIAEQSIEKYKRIERQLEEQRRVHKQQIFRIQQDQKRLAQQAKNNFSQELPAIAPAASIQKSDGTALEAQLEILKCREAQWATKEQHIRNMLAGIWTKVEKEERHCRDTQDKVRSYRQEVELWREKYEAKCKSSRENSQKWRLLFGQLMQETVQTKREVEAVKKMLHRMIRREVRQLKEGTQMTLGQ